MKTYRGKITKLNDNQVFVFGCNPVGINQRGAALFASNNGWCELTEIIDNSYSKCKKAWGITTVTFPGNKRSIPPHEMVHNICLMLEECNKSGKEFLVAYTLERNLNGYSPEQMAVFFAQALKITPCENVVFESNFGCLVMDLS